MLKKQMNFRRNKLKEKMLFKGPKNSLGKKIGEISQHILSWLKKHEFQQRIDKVKKAKSHQNDFPFQKKKKKKKKKS